MNTENGYDIEDPKVGMAVTFAKTITEADIVLFAGVSGDNNAFHTNEQLARTTPFGDRIAHGFLTESVLSAVAANRVPGTGTVYLGQHMRFKAPVRPGDKVHATVTIKSVDLAKARATLETVCSRGDKVAIEGGATVMTTSSVRLQQQQAAA